MERRFMTILQGLLVAVIPRETVAASSMRIREGEGVSLSGA
jgi:hypothetical protein